MPGRYESDETIAYKKAAQELDKHTRLLCAACREMERISFDMTLVPGLIAWWTEHKEADDLRIKEEYRQKIKRLLQKPVGSLTMEEFTFLREEKAITL